MPDIISLKRNELRKHVDQLVLARKDRGPTQDADQIRRAALFLPTARQLGQELKDTNGNNPRNLTDAEAQELGLELGVAAEEYGQAFQLFREMDVGMVRRGRPNLVYSVAIRSAADKGAETLQALRSVVGDALDGGDPISRAIREGCGVGIPIRLDAPAEVQRALEVAQAVLTDPNNASTLAALGARRAILTRQVTQAAQAIATAMEAGPGEAILLARQRRDEAQLRVEAIAIVILTLVATGLGKAKRDELRALWPTSSSRKVTEGGEGDLDGNITDANGSVVPAPVLGNGGVIGNAGTTGTPLSHTPEGPTPAAVPLLQPLFGTTTPTALIAAKTGDGNGSSPPVVANGANGTASHVANGMSMSNGASNGVSHG